MNHRLRGLGLALLLVAPACLGAGPAAGVADDGSASAGATAPTPFALQFVGAYEALGVPAGALRWLALQRDGSYEALAQGSSSVEAGAFVAAPALALPLTLTSGQGAWTASITAYDGALYIQRAGVTSTLLAVSPVGPSEALCDATEGEWTDDDADPSTGLYCVCPAPSAYIPSVGGCVP